MLVEYLYDSSSDNVGVYVSIIYRRLVIESVWLQKEDITNCENVYR